MTNSRGSRCALYALVICVCASVFFMNQRFDQMQETLKCMKNPDTRHEVMLEKIEERFQDLEAQVNFIEGTVRTLWKEPKEK